MKTKLYKLEQENFETILAYYNTIKLRAKKYYNYILKYKEITNNYLLNIKQLFIKEENISNLNNFLNDYKTISIDYNINFNDNKQNNINNINNNLIEKKKINISTIQHSVAKINKFFNLQIEALQLFVGTIQTPLAQLYQIIEQSQVEIENIKNDYETQKETFFKKYCIFRSLNKELLQECAEQERELINFTIKKKSLNNKEEEQNLENNLNLKLLEKVNDQKAMFDKFKNLNNFGKIYNDTTNQKINQIKEKSSTLFKQFEMCINNLLIFYKKSFLLPINQIENQEKEIEDINEFDNLLKSNIKEIDEQTYQLNFEKYNLKVLKKIDYDQEPLKVEKKGKNNFSKNINSELTSEEKELLQEEDIFYIVKKMYNFKIIDQSNYVIKIEKEKLKLKEKIDKLTRYGNERKNSIDLKLKNWTLLDNNKINNDINNKDDIRQTSIIENIDEIEKIDKNENKINNNNKNQKDKNNKKKSKTNKKEKNEEDDNLIFTINNINFEEINEMANYNNELNLNNKKKAITKDDINYLCKSMSKYEYREYFLNKLNNFRANGAFNMPLDIFNYVVQIFKEITKYLYIKEKNEYKIDMFIARLAIILSQTFFCVKNNKKVYIQNEIKNEKVFHSIDFWHNLIKKNIEREEKKVIENSKIILEEENELNRNKRQNNVTIAQMIPYLTGMKGFDVDLDNIKKVANSFIDEYKITEENKQIIYKCIEDPELI